MSDIEFPETYRNCCKIPHYICSIIICIIFFILGLFVLFTSTCNPKIVEDIYVVGASHWQIRVAGVITSLIHLGSCCFLAYGIARDWALALLTWMIIGILIFQLHLILLICAFVYLALKDTRPSGADWTRIPMLCVLQGAWLVLIIMIGRHWYAICEEIYAQDYEGFDHRIRGRSHRDPNSRRLLLSLRSRVSFTRRIGNRQPEDFNRTRV